jgi:hypothetical protein
MKEIPTFVKNIIFLIMMTICSVIVLRSLPIQKYDFPNDETRCNKFTGQVEYYSRYFGKWCPQG